MWMEKNLIVLYVWKSIAKLNESYFVMYTLW